MRYKHAVDETHDSHEESGNESERNNQRNNDSSDDDSDCSSELDEKECEYRRAFCLDTSTLLERKFATLKERLYIERVTQIEQLLHGVRNGTSNNYLVPLNKLQEEMMTRIHIANQLRRIRLINIKNVFDAEEQAARQNLAEHKILVYEALHEELLEKMRKLEEDRLDIEFSWCDNQTSWNKTKTRGSSKNKPVTVTGPYIVYNLDEKDILEDWAIIRRSLKNTLSVL